MEKKNEVESVVEAEVSASYNGYDVADQAETIVAGMLNVVGEVAEVAEQTFIASTGIDALEASVKAATIQYMRENGFSSCPISLKGMELALNVKADVIPRTIATRIKALCDCHSTGKSYKIKVSDLAEHAVCSRKGEKDWRKEIAKAISIIMTNTSSYFEKNGTEVKASNPVLFSIENKLKKADSLFIHFHTKSS